MIYGDPLHLKQVLINFITNAVKFTEIGHVSINISVESAYQKDILLKFAIQDTGIGLSSKSWSKFLSLIVRSIINSLKNMVEQDLV